MKYLHNLIILFISLLASFNVNAAPEAASDILSKSTAKISKSPSIKASYTLTSDNDGTISGSLLLAGDKFRMTSPSIITWYDGMTQWTYIVADKEVNISEPTAEELQQVNPFVIINKFRNGYTASLLKSTVGKKKIELKASRKNADIASATLTINATTYLPEDITLKLSDNHTITIRLSNVEIGKKLPDSNFKFDKKRYPKVEIIDLR